MFRLAQCCVRIMWRPPIIHQQSGSYIPNPFQVATFQQLFQSQSQGLEHPGPPDLLQLRAQAEAYRAQQEQQQQVAQYVVQQNVIHQQQQQQVFHQQHQQVLEQQQQVLEQQQQALQQQQQVLEQQQQQGQLDEQQYQQQQQQHQPHQERWNNQQQVQPSPITGPPLVAHKFYHESTKEFYNRFYSLTACSSSTISSPENIGKTESQETVQVKESEYSPVIEQHEIQDNTVVDNNLEIVQVQENPPTIDSLDSDMKPRPHSSTSKRSHRDSDKAPEYETSPAKHLKVAESEKKDMEIVDDPAVLAVGCVLSSQSSKGVSKASVQSLGGGGGQKLDMQQARHYSTHSPSHTATAASSPSKSPGISVKL